MATSFPGGVDVYSVKATGTTVEAQHMNDVQDAIRAIEAKVGPDAGALTSSLDYLVKTAANPGHTHSSGSITSVTEAAIVRPGSPILARRGSDEAISGLWTFNSRVTVGAVLQFTAGYATAGAVGDNYMTLGGGGVSPNAGSIGWGNGSGWKLHLGTFKPAFTPVMTLMDTSKVGINVQTPIAALQVSNTATVADFTSATERGVLSITGPSATNTINALTFTAADNNVQSKIASVKRTAGTELRFGASDGAAVANWAVLDHLGAMGIGDVMKQRASLIFGFEMWTSDSSRRGLFQGYIANDTSPPVVRLAKSRGTYGSALPVQSGDIIGHLALGGNYMTASTPIFYYSASITATADQNFTASACGSRLSFYTTPVNAVANVEVLRLTSDGKMGVGITTPHADIQLKSAVGRKLVLFENTDSDDDVYGWIIATNLLRHAVPPGANHGFYVGPNRMVRIEGTGTVFGDTSVAPVASLEVKGTYAIGKSRQYTVTSIGQSFHNVDVSGVAVIEFIDGTGGAINGQPFYLTGLANGVTNQRVIIKNTTAGSLIVKQGDTGSSSGNRLFTFQVADLQSSNNSGGLIEFWKGGNNPIPWLLMWHTRAAVQGL